MNNKKQSTSIILAVISLLGVYGCGTVKKVAVGSFKVSEFAYKGVVGTGKTVYRGGKVLTAVATGTYDVSKAVVGGAVGAGALVYSGGRSALGAFSDPNKNNDPYYVSYAQQTQSNEPRCLHADGSYSPAYKNASGIYSCS